MCHPVHQFSIAITIKAMLNSEAISFKVSNAEPDTEIYESEEGQVVLKLDSTRARGIFLDRGLNRCHVSLKLVN